MKKLTILFILILSSIQVYAQNEHNNKSKIKGFNFK